MPSVKLLLFPTLIVLGILSVMSPVLAQSFQTKIEAIAIEGNQHIDEQAILGKLSIKPGDSFTQESIREQIQLIYGMGFFEEVEVSTEARTNGVLVVFRVKEKPFTVEVVFDGNDELSDDKLNEKNTIKNQVFLDKEQVKVSVENFRQLYHEKGFYHVQIIPITDMVENNQARLTYYIEEGRQAHIRTIEFEGRNVLKKKELTSFMANREYSWPWSIFSDAGILHRDELPNDVERIKEVYLNKGYLDVQVGMPRIDLDETKEWFTLVFPIVEGEPYIVSQIQYTGQILFSEEELRNGLNIEPGEVFQRAKIRDEITRLTDLYGSRGYAFAEVNPSVDPDPQTRSTRISFSIQEGEMVRIQDIRITGNSKTRDNVIRRELRVDERDMIDSPAIKRSFERLNNLNFFETVEILPKQIAPGEVDLEVKVKEKPTGSFSIGGGFSTLDQFTAIADITEGNLFGRGYLGRIRGQVGGRRTLGIITFRNPAVFDTLTSVQADGFRSRTNFLTYLETKAGANLTFGRGFSEYITGTFTLVAEHIKLSSIDSDAPDIIKDQKGTQSTTGFRASLFRDSRDFYLDPRRGTRVGVRTSLGTQTLGGSNNFYSVSFDAMKYTPLPFWDFRHSIRARVGYGQGFGGEELPVPEFFFVGGINTVRGFKFGRAGPVTSRGTAEGANKQLIFNNDLIFPVLPDAKLNGVLFFDYGQGFAKGEKLSFDLRSAAGLEVRWISPFGPLRAAYGFNLDKRPGEKSSVFEFSVGSVF
ncbi:MAG TPA: outer membrane protein assembly factor BamA [Nitrospirales bacterium]|nr:outer membrane protein assembly factor BamA [Nitrospirales bacterium]